MRHQKGLDADGGRRVDDLAQLGMHGDFQMRLFAAFGLALIDRQHAVVDMLPSHPDDIARRWPV